MESNLPVSAELTLKNKGRIYNLCAFPVKGGNDGVFSVICFYRDITEERALQEKIIQSEKMMAIGHLAGEVSHEIYNPLGGILAFTQLLMRQEPYDEKQRAYLEEIESSVIKCKTFLRSLLAFSRRPMDNEYTSVDLHKIIEKSIDLAMGQFEPHRIGMVKQLSEGDCLVWGNAVQLQETLVHLITSSARSLREEGTITISTARGRGDTVVVSLKDTGEGMPEDFKSRIFEPHFTTKDLGRSIGLGMTMVYIIVKQHRGSIELKSGEGRGVEFIITFPEAPPSDRCSDKWEAQICKASAS